MAQVEYFLKIDGVEGESQNLDHLNEIDLQSWSYSAKNTGSGSGGAGASTIHDISVTKLVDKSSAGLMLACATGQKFPTAVITARKAGGSSGNKPVDFITIKMSDVIVSSYQIGGSAAHQTIPLDQVGLNFVKWEITYKVQNPDGSAGPATTKKFDVSKNKGS